MGQIPHDSATTTMAIRRAIHHSQQCLRAFATRYSFTQDRRIVEEVNLRRKHPNRIPRAQIHRLGHRSGGHCGRLPAPTLSDCL